MLVARALGYKANDHCKAAAIIEFIHTATLLHDDVVDDSELRRGNKTANNVFGNSVSILTGDFLYSRAFQMMVELKEMPIMKVLANATNKIAEGEILQLLNCSKPGINEEDYMNIIYCKTGRLFEAACDIAAILAAADNDQLTAINKYGIHLGNAFQITDDALDYISDRNTMGKNVGDDLLTGKVTLPLIYTLRNTDDSSRSLISKAIKHKDSSELTKIRTIVLQSGAIDYTLKKAKSEACLAMNNLDILPNSNYKDALKLLCRFAVERSK
jgi:octaprenyl-diphosphate synthase